MFGVNAQWEGAMGGAEVVLDAAFGRKYFSLLGFIGWDTKHYSPDKSFYPCEANMGPLLMFWRFL